MLAIELLDDDWNNCHKPYALWEKSRDDARDGRYELDYKKIEATLVENLKDEDNEGLKKLMLNYTGISRELIKYLDGAEIEFSLSELLNEHAKRVKGFQKLYFNYSANLIMFSVCQSAEYFAVLVKTGSEDRINMEYCIKHLNNIFGLLMDEYDLRKSLGRQDILTFPEHLADLQKN